MRVTESMGPAWETMKRILFRPFRAGTWFSFGFIFFLQSCLEGGGGGGNGLRIPDLGGSGSRGGGGGGEDTGNNLAGLAHQLGSHLGPFEDLLSGDGPNTSLLVIIGVVALIIAIPLVVLAMWLGSRGQMMAIRAVASGQGDISPLWSATREAGSAMFKFQLVMLAIAMAIFLPILGVGAAILVPAFRAGTSMTSVLPVVIGIGLLALLFVIPLALVGAMARNFVAPIMLKHGVGAREGWKRFWVLGQQHVGSILGFFVLRVLVGVLAGIIGLVASVLTCCLGFLPVLHQTLMAPYYVFERAWTLEVLASMSPEFDLRGMGEPPPQTPFGGGGAGGGNPPYSPYGGPPTDNPYAPPGYGGGGGNPYGGGGGGYGGPPPAGGFGAP